MQIVIVGAGLLGVTTAWYLRQAGHQVRVIERREAPALEASFANGGQISISHPEPWANPGAPAQVLRWLGRKDAPLLFRLPAEPERWRWGLSFLRECLPGRSRRNTLAIARLAAYSAESLRALRHETGLRYDQQSRGVIHLYFSPRELKHGRAQHRILNRLGIPASLLSAAQCVDAEPALASLADRLVGGMQGHDDESGDAHRFTTELARLAAEAGVEFIFNSEVESFETHEGRISAVHLLDNHGRRGALGGDLFVLTAGVWSRGLVHELGERLPIYPVKGYSITAPVLDARRAPTASITDESHRIVCSRLGDRLRVAGTAELNGYDQSLDPERCDALVRWLADAFPGACDLHQAEPWAGLRPATPSNVPLIGRSRLHNLYYNTGHGTLGWTLSCGSARALADIIDRQAPEPQFPFLRNGRP